MLFVALLLLIGKIIFNYENRDTYRLWFRKLNRIIWVPAGLMIRESRIPSRHNYNKDFMIIENQKQSIPKQWIARSKKRVLKCSVQSLFSISINEILILVSRYSLCLVAWYTMQKNFVNELLIWTPPWGCPRNMNIARESLSDKLNVRIGILSIS